MGRAEHSPNFDVRKRALRTPLAKAAAALDNWGMTAPRGYWLLKSEPETYSFDDLRRDCRTRWDGVRNFQARNFLREAQKGDVALFYHSGDERAVVGVAHVVRAAYPDPTANEGDWSAIDIAAARRLPKPVSLAEIKTKSTLATLPLLKQSRLSVMPITATHFTTLLRMGGDEG